MKLRNKKTGKITKLDIHCILGKVYETLAEINDEWEDYEEPKEHWYISAYGHLGKTDVMTDLHRGAEGIGNLFETKEEAEKAVEKLKAWKRLKDTITCIDRASFDDVGTATLFIRYEKEDHKKVEDDLDLLFGGEE